MRILQSAGLALLLFLSINLNAQDFEVPKGYELKSIADYAKYEKDIIEAAIWLKETPLKEQEDKRKEVSAFVIAWINGSPTVNVEITPAIMDFENRNPGMMILYMAGCARFVLENNYSKNVRAKHKAALQDMVWVYRAGYGIKNDKKMERLAKFDDENRIEEWIDVNMKTN